MLAPVSWFEEGWLGQSCAIVVHGYEDEDEEDEDE